jgi:hypothetical protein
MALEKGDITASYGMAKVIYEKLQEMFLPSVAAGGADIAGLQESWQKMAYAVASGVIDHIKSNMEIVDVKTKWRDTDTTEIDGTTSINSGHSHTVKVNGRNNNLIFEQSNSGLNLVK